MRSIFAFIIALIALPQLAAAYPINEPVSPTAAASSRFTGVNEAVIGDAPLDLRIMTGGYTVFRPGSDDLNLVFSHLAFDVPLLNDVLALDAQLNVRSLLGNPVASLEDRAALRLRYVPVSSHGRGLGFG